MTIKTLLAAAALAATAAPALAQTTFVTGIGFGTDRNQAMSHMIIAWTTGALQTYGAADWNLATRGPVNCTELQPASGGVTTMDSTPGADIFTHGNPASATWSCSVEAAMR
ncbi:MAG: hypothetical protein AAF748_06270 [Pseudomonadota bacterium]